MKTIMTEPCKGSIAVGNHCGDCAHCVIEAKKIIRECWRVPLDQLDRNRAREINEASAILIVFDMLAGFLSELRDEIQVPNS